MFVVSVKTNRRRLLTTAALVIGLVILAAVLCCRRGAATTAQTRVADDAARRGFLTALGYTVAETAPQVREVLLPEEFDEALNEYNRLQQDAGYDLLPYAGERVKCWTYTLTQTPEEGDTVLARLYICRDTVIGGDIASTRQGGFTKGLVPLDDARDTWAPQE